MFDDGTSLLLTGPSPELDPRLFEAITPGDDERAIVITMNLGAARVVDELQDRGADPGQIGVIDCTNQSESGGDARVRQLSSPGDLTGISLEFAKLLDDVEGEPVRIGFASISTGLMYAELRTMFRFLHVFTARIRSGDMFGLFTMDPSMHEEQSYNTIRAVFDCEAVIDDDSLDLRGTGFERD